MPKIPQNKRVVVKMGAQWCGPCKALDKLIEANPPKTPVVFCDIDDDFELASQYNIRGVPTLLFIEDGEEVKRFTGTPTKDELVTMLAWAD